MSFDLTFWAAVIEAAGALFIFAYSVRALALVVRIHQPEAARLLLIEGALLGLSIKVAATLLKTIELHTWQQIGMFAAIFTLRTVLKMIFTSERKQIERHLPAHQTEAV